VYSYKGVGEVWHCHLGIELQLITKGHGMRYVGDSIVPFKASDLVLLGAGLPHFWHSVGPMEGYALQFGCGPESGLGSLPETEELHHLFARAQKGIQFTGRLAAEVAEMIGFMPQSGSVRRMALLLSILEKLQRTNVRSQRILSQNFFSPLARQGGAQGIQKAIHRILNSFQEDLTLADMLKESCMSKATFSRQFKRCTGNTFSRFLTEIRIASAGRQLMKTGLSITEVSFACGFKSLSHFHHQFVLKTGESPGTFRRRMQPTGLRQVAGAARP